MSTASQHFSQETCFIRSLKFRVNSFLIQCVIRDTCLNAFWWWWFFGWFCCLLLGFLLSKDIVRTIITSPQASTRRDKLKVHPLTEATLQQRKWIGVLGVALCGQKMMEQQRLEGCWWKRPNHKLLSRQRSYTCVFQMCTHLSKEPLARYLPSGLKATLYTGSWCFVRVWIQIPLSTSHNLTVESKDALSREKTQINYISI